MTAEILIMNNSAIAIAADKIFMLSKYHPVGIMIFQNAQFLNIPWETLVKQYRTKLKQKSFNTIEDYAKDFQAYLSSNLNFILENGNEINLFELCIKRDCEFIRDTLLTLIDIITNIEGSISTNGLNEAINRSIFTQMNQNGRIKAIKKVKEEFKTLYDYYYNESHKYFEKIKDETFEKLPLDQTQIKNINEYVVENFLYQSIVTRKTGIVIMGFGNKQILPSYIRCECYGVINKKLSFYCDPPVICGKDGIGIIETFAQSDVIQNYVHGISPQLINEEEINLKNIIHSKISQIEKKIEDLGLSNEELLNFIKDSLEKDFFSEWNKALKKSITKFNQPLITIISFLPKSELAEIAESLVHLTSMKRRVSHDSETVGGPIDVAIITKGDGFVWIKRKHYFDKELNLHFEKKYMDEDIIEKRRGIFRGRL